MREDNIKKILAENIGNIFFLYCSIYYSGNQADRMNCYMSLRALLHFAEESGLFTKKEIDGILEDSLEENMVLLDIPDTFTAQELNYILNDDEAVFMSFIDRCNTGMGQRMYNAGKGTP